MCILPSICGELREGTFHQDPNTWDVSWLQHLFDIEHVSRSGLLPLYSCYRTSYEAGGLDAVCRYICCSRIDSPLLRVAYILAKLRRFA